MSKQRRSAKDDLDVKDNLLSLDRLGVRQVVEGLGHLVSNEIGSPGYLEGVELLEDAQGTFEFVSEEWPQHPQRRTVTRRPVERQRRKRAGRKR